MGLNIVSYFSYMKFLLPAKRRVQVTILVSECMHVRSVCMWYDNFRKHRRKKLTFGLRVHLERLLVKFVYEGHWIKVKAKVAGANKRENPSPAM